MTITEATIEVGAPLSVVHGAWSHFEQLADVLCGIEGIRWIDDSHLHVVGRVRGVLTEWDLHITEDLPDRRVAWTSTGGVRHDGAVTVEPLSASRTRVTLVLDEDGVDPSDVGDAAPGARGNRAWFDLDRFRAWIEDRAPGVDRRAG